MIGPDEAQDGIIAKLKADANLTAWLTNLSVSAEIREAFWQAKEFKYPCVRVSIGVCTPYGGDTCELVKSEIQFQVQAFSVEASSKQCGHLIGLVVKALFGKYIQTTTWKTQRVQLLQMTGPVQEVVDLWQSAAQFRMLVQE
jgi:hypothetical protein